MNKKILLLFLLEIIAISLPYFSVNGSDIAYDGVIKNTRFGLWNMCSESLDSKTKACIYIPSDKNKNFPKKEFLYIRYGCILSLAIVLMMLLNNNSVKYLRFLNMIVLFASMYAWYKYMRQFEDDDGNDVYFDVGPCFYILIFCAFYSF